MSRRSRWLYCMHAHHIRLGLHTFWLFLFFFLYFFSVCVGQRAYYFPLICINNIPTATFCGQELLGGKPRQWISVHRSPNFLSLNVMESIVVLPSVEASTTDKVWYMIFSHRFCCLSWNIEENSMTLVIWCCGGTMKWHWAPSRWLIDILEYFSVALWWKKTRVLLWKRNVSMQKRRVLMRKALILMQETLLLMQNETLCKAMPILKQFIERGCELPYTVIIWFSL